MSNVNEKEPRTPGGLKIVAQAGNLADRSKLPESTDKIEVISSSKILITFKCGHEGPERFKLNVYGENSKEISKDDTCPSCWIEKIKKYVARCSLCGLPVYPGEGVALYDSHSEGLRVDIARKVDENHVIGCIRWDCCLSGGFFAGYWTEQGFKSVLGDSPKTAAEQAFDSGKIITGNMRKE